MDAGNDIEIPTFSIDTEIQQDISINIEISIYDPLTSIEYTEDNLTNFACIYYCGGLMA